MYTENELLQKLDQIGIRGSDTEKVVFEVTSVAIQRFADTAPNQGDEGASEPERLARVVKATWDEYFEFANKHAH